MRETGHQVQLAKPGDAAGIVGLVRSCYGSGYANAQFLDAEWVANSIRDGQTTYTVARDSAGRHVGQCAFQRLHPAGLYEHSKAIVVDEQRGRGLMGAMSRVLFGEAERLGVELLLGHSVTTHVYTQSCTRSAGYEPLGLLLGMWPARCIAGQDPAGPAVSCLLEGLQVGSQPRVRQLTLRGADRVFAETVLANLKIPSGTEAARGFYRPLALEAQVDSSLELLRLSFASGATHPLRELSDLVEEPHRTVWADVPAEHPQATRLTESLRSLGFTLAAYIPLGGPQGEDVLRLQRFRGQPVEIADLRLLAHSRPLCAEVLGQSLAEVAA